MRGPADMHKHPPPAPTHGSERHRALDALRGLALLGILLANILYWSGWLMMPPALAATFHDERSLAWIRGVERFLVEGKFYTLFSMLFGLGGALMMQRLQTSGHAWERVYYRRMAVLLAIGLLHTLLVWDGDILLLYATLGFLLPWFARQSDRVLLGSSVVLILLVPLLGQGLMRAMGWAPGKAVQDMALQWFQGMGGAPFGQEVPWLQAVTLADYPKWTVTGTLYSLGLRIESWRIPKVMGIMVLGLWIGRRLQHGLLSDRRFLVRALIAGALVGIPASAVYALHPESSQDHWSSTLGTVPLAIAYAAAFMLAWPSAQRWLGVFAAPGRMPLTNYLTHSVINGIAFFGFGFGLIGTLSLWQTYGWALALFTGQVMASRWWLQRHEQGPMEALWRRATYRASVATRGNGDGLQKTC